MPLVRVRARARVCILFLCARWRGYASYACAGEGMPPMRVRARVCLLCVCVAGQGIPLVGVRARVRVCLLCVCVGGRRRVYCSCACAG